MLNNRTLITGIHGFCGRHLSDHLLQHGYAVYGIDLTPGTVSSAVTVYTGDMLDPAFVQDVVLTVCPAAIYHLAALTDPEADLEVLYEVNVLGTKRLLDCVRQAGLDALILIAGSSAVYGRVEVSHLPIRESQPFHPLNAYAVSKIAQEMVGYTYYARHGIRVIRTRAFNLIGPGQPPHLACSAFARQIAAIEARQGQPVLHVGNLASQRDFVDVRDAVCAYRLLAEHGRPGKVYNICSGRAVSIQACLDELLRVAQIPIKVKQDPARLQMADAPISVGDGNCLHRQTGWRPMIRLKQSLADLLQEWRRRIQEV